MWAFSLPLTAINTIQDIRKQISEPIASLIGGQHLDITFKTDSKVLRLKSESISLDDGIIGETFYIAPASPIFLLKYMPICGDRMTKAIIPYNSLNIDLSQSNSDFHTKNFIEKQKCYSERIAVLIWYSRNCEHFEPRRFV